MLNTSKLLLLAVAMLVTAAIVTPAAFAQSNPENHETLEFTNESFGGHCSAVTKPTAHTVSGGCLFHGAGGTAELRKHVFGIESHITTCGAEFHGRVNEDAEGVMVNQTFSGASCNRQPCQEAGEAGPTPWPVHGDEAHNVGIDGESGLSPVDSHREFLTVTFCVEPIGGGADESCEIDFAANQVGATHASEYGGANESPAHGVSGYRCEIVGHWTTETGGAGEINPVVIHLPNENKTEVP
jgi:hypothetical protein